MPKTLEHEVFKPKVIKCARCQKTIGTTAFDSQILVIGDMAFMNYACWTHICGKSASWLAPLLPTEKPTLENEFPDVGDIQTKALTLKEKAEKFGYRLKQKDADYQPQQNTAQTSAS